MRLQNSFVTIFTVLFALMLRPSVVAQTSAPSPTPSATTGRYQPTTIPSISDNVYNKLSPDEQNEADEAQQILDSENRQSHDIYGRVVDQFGQPVVGAQAIATSLFNVSFTASRNEDHFTTTDSDGRFQFTGILGAKLGVGIKKMGYTWSGQSTPPAQGQSSLQNRVVYTMYKLQGAEPMVHQDFHFSIPCDGTPTSVDLQAGKVVTNGGDLIISFTRNPVQIHRGTPFEWTLTLKAADGGGLLEVQDSYANVAPDSGYEAAVTVGTGANPKTNISSASQTYYLKSPGGKYYGKITFRIQTDFQPPPTFVQIDAYVNPSGSRNLEFDETKQVKP